MWSVNRCPNPGVVRMLVSSSSWVGSGRRSTATSSPGVGALMGSRYFLARDPRGDGVARLGGTPGRRHASGGPAGALLEVGEDGRLDPARRAVESQVLEEQRPREDRGRGVGLLLPRDVGGRPVHRLEP